MILHKDFYRISGYQTDSIVPVSNEEEDYSDEDNADTCINCNSKNIVCYDKTGYNEAYKCLKCGNMWISY